MKGKYLQHYFVLIAVLILLQNASAQSKQPKNVREYFMILPQTYFPIESCNTDIVKDCRPFKVEYLKRFLKVEDTKNGYLEGDGDGAQEHFKMALFKRPNGSHIVGLYVFGEWGEKYYFLEYKKRRSWRALESFALVPLNLSLWIFESFAFKYLKRLSLQTQPFIFSVYEKFR